MCIRDSRSAREREQVELALRMLAHRARVPLIERWTGLSATRIAGLLRELRAIHPDQSNRFTPKRGRFPDCPTFYVSTLYIQSEATLLCAFLHAAEVLCFGAEGARRSQDLPKLEFATRFCNAFDSYQLVVTRPQITFERGWYVLKAFERRTLELGLCRRCRSRYVRETYQVDNHECPQCKLKAERLSTRRGSRCMHGARQLDNGENGGSSDAT